MSKILQILPDNNMIFHLQMHPRRSMKVNLLGLLGLFLERYNYTMCSKGNPEGPSLCIQNSNIIFRLGMFNAKWSRKILTIKEYTTYL